MATNIKKLFIAIAAVIMVVSTFSCTVEYRERQRHYHEDHDDHHDDHDHDHDHNGR